LDCANWPAAGLSTFWPITSAPAAARLSAAFFSLAMSNHDFVHTSLTFAPGCVAWAPSANAFACRITSGIGNGTT